jgi:hypothetical protein
MNILTVNLVLSTIVFAVAAKLYLIPLLPRLEPRSVVLPILLLHALRHLGLMFLAPGAVFPGIPEQFAYPAAFGDLIAAVLALIAIAAVVRRSFRATARRALQRRGDNRSHARDFACHHLRSGAVHGARLLDTGVLGAGPACDSLRGLYSSW